MSVLAAGVDLSGRTVGTTAIAFLRGEAERPRLVGMMAGRELSGDTGDAAIVERLAAQRPGVVAIDAPLTLPHPLTCADPDCPVCFPDSAVAPSYGSRGVDRAEAWRAIGHVEKPPMPAVMVAGIAFRAIYLRRRLEAAGLEVIETWPMAVYRLLARHSGDAAAPTTDAWRRGLLEKSVDGLAVLDTADHKRALRDRLDAVAAAYVGSCWLRETARSITGALGPREGVIWIPKTNEDVAACA
jgi:predicted nuclease with RNAse H fold